MDIFSPAILEVPVISTMVGDEIPSSLLPSVLTPRSIKGHRNASGKYKRIIPGMYVYNFDHMTATSNATMHQFQGLVKISEPVFHVELKHTWPVFQPPKFFLTDYTYVGISVKLVAPIVFRSIPTITTPEGMETALAEAMKSVPSKEVEMKF